MEKSSNTNDELGNLEIGYSKDFYPSGKAKINKIKDNDIDKTIKMDRAPIRTKSTQANNTKLKTGTSSRNAVKKNIPNKTNASSKDVKRKKISNQIIFNEENLKYYEESDNELYSNLGIEEGDMEKNKKDAGVSKNSSNRSNKKNTKSTKKNSKIEEDNIEKQTTARKERKSKKKKGKAGKIILAIVLVILIILGIFIGIRIKENGGGMKGIVATILGHDASTLENLPELRFLVIGQSQNLTDTLMVCSYNPRTQKASILSIPRDTFTGNNKNSASAFDKINALYQQSPEKLIKEVNELTGLNIKYYVHVDTDGLVDVVDAIGGVQFDVPINMNYDDTSQDLHIHLTAGTQTLNGDKAEQLLRFRHNNNGTTYSSEYGQQDIGRMKTQREFLKAVIKKMAKAENITKIDEFITIANKYITTNMDFSSLKDYAPYALEFNSENVRTETMPGESQKCNGLWFYVCNKKETLTLVEDMFNLGTSTDTSEEGTTETTTKSSTTNSDEVNVSGIKVEILNGTSTSSNATELKTKLQKAGFTVSKTGTTSKTSKTTIINRTKKADEISEKLQNTVGAGTISSGSDNAKVDYTIVIGSDY